MANDSMSGKLGTVTGQVAGMDEVVRWNCAITSEALDATSKLSAGWKEKILGLQGGNGSFTAVGDTAPVIPLDSAPTWAMVLKTDTTPTTTVTATAIATNLAIESDVEGIVTYTVDFEFTAAVVLS